MKPSRRWRRRLRFELVAFMFIPVGMDRWQLGILNIEKRGLKGFRFRFIDQLNPLMSDTSGMNKLTTMKPTARPKNTIIKGSIKAVRPSVITLTSSSYVSATL